MTTTAFKPFSIGAGALVIDQSTWEALTALNLGFPTGILTKEHLNKALRQASVPGAALMQAMAEVQASPVPDDGNFASLVTRIKTLITSVSAAPVVNLTATEQIFITAQGGSTPAPATVVLTAVPSNIPGASYQWYVDNALVGGAVSNTFTLNAFAATDSRVVRVVATGTDSSTAFDAISIFSLQEGGDALSAGLENENRSISCTNLGVPKAGSFPQTSQMVAARGATILATPAVSFSVVESQGIESAGVTTGASANVSINSSTGVISIGTIAAGVTYARAKFRATIGSTTLDRTLTMNKTLDGDKGADGGLEALSLVASGQIFVRSADGSTITPASITLTALAQNVTGSPTWTTTPNVTLSGGASDPSRTLTAVNFGNNDSVVVRATWGGQYDEVTLYRLREGSDAFSWGLVNEQQNISCDSTGAPFSVGSGLPINSQMIVARGAAVLTTGVVYSLQSSSGFAGITINPSTGVIAITGITADSATAKFAATIGSVVLTKDLTANKIRQGQQGTGGTGPAGTSAVVAYAVYNGNPVVSGGPVVTSGTTVPAAGAYAPAAVSSFSYVLPTPGAGQSVMRVDGAYNAATGQTTWQTPYLASFRVGSLSAISADLGEVISGLITGARIRTAAFGARIELDHTTNTLVGYSFNGNETFKLDVNSGAVTMQGSSNIPLLSVINSFGMAISAQGSSNGPAVNGSNLAGGAAINGLAVGGGAAVRGNSVGGPGGHFSSLRLDQAFTTSNGGGAITYQTNAPAGTGASVAGWVRVTLTDGDYWLAGIKV